jgi:hypothetical protein
MTLNFTKVVHMTHGERAKVRFWPSEALDFCGFFTRSKNSASQALHRNHPMRERL